MARLPSFSDLLAFDAVARTGAFTRAARERNVSQPAISRRVAALEQDLGRRLIDRGTKPITLTEAGQQLFETLRSGLSRLEAVVERLRAEGEQQSISISADSGFTAFWLIPRLPALQQACPGVRLRLISEADGQARALGDLQIRFGAGKRDGLVGEKILGEAVYPVASPMYLQGRAPALDAASLQGEDLLELEGGGRFWHDWSSWFESVAAPPSRPLRRTRFDSYMMMVSAALAGNGVCLCWDGLLDTFLEAGALLRLTEEQATSDRGYHLLHRDDLEPGSPILEVSRQILALSAAGLQADQRVAAAAMAEPGVVNGGAIGRFGS